ncbi:GLIPR1-like protein 1 [Epinephelus fuscoguttatus]|uniref:GLIPR1-like protein 1 n=1 Tax=Epinephelus fuscoguttatus TaxID=293821 RepID=UPI0020D18366|nr:GLIPR1-like protein 1 [Epinephelus fuscoguttatus]
MESVVEMLLWAWIILDVGVCSVSLPEITDGKFIDECVREHNRARSSVSPPASDMLYMTWDEGLAITARAWARHCVFEHNGYLKDVRRVHPTFSSVGENIWTSSSPHFDVSRAIKRWVDEKQDYDYNRNICTKVCGHYTQVVWASSFKVGCAVQLCTNGVKYTSFADQEGILFVCNYATAGNVNGGRPYNYEGAVCSKCKGTCVENLCRSQERDSQKSYNWTPDWDPALATGGSNYVTILVVRPIALIFTFITAYAIRHFYPDVFCYE